MSEEEELLDLIYKAGQTEIKLTHEASEKQQADVMQVIASMGALRALGPDPQLTQLAGLLSDPQSTP